MQEKNIKFVWYSDGTRKLKVPESIFEEFAQYEQRADPNESGGILLGLVFNDYDEPLELVKPSKSDKMGLHMFIRRRSPAQRKINRAWSKSGGYMIYLGEWHTHPGCDPTPSGQDKKMIKNAVQTTKMEIGYLYLIIAGKNRSFWIGRQDTDKLKTLEPQQ
jgi:integrative and conjugative element protein (TIGR02256 family)